MPSSALANGETTRLPLWSVLATIGVCTAVKTSKADLFKNLQLPTMVLQVSISLSNTSTSLSLSLCGQRHKKQVFVGDTTTSVTELKVLPDCDYQSVNAYSHQLKQYWGHKEVSTVLYD